MRPCSQAGLKIRAVGTLRRALVLTVCVVGVSIFPTVGVAGIAKYRGMHPLSPHVGAYCYIDLVHVHAKAPPDMRVYRVLPNQEHLFVGDDAALGYDGPRHGYFGPHPLTFPGLSTPEPTFCYLRGPHNHARKPESDQKFVFKDGVYWYVGAWPATFERDRHNLWINDAGAVGKYQRPKVDISAAPPGYQFPAVAELPKPPIAIAQPGTAKPSEKIGAKPSEKPARKRGTKTGVDVGAKEGGP